MDETTEPGDVTPNDGPMQSQPPNPGPMAGNTPAAAASQAPASNDADVGWGPVILAAIGATLLGAVLALGVLSYINGGQLEFQPASSTASVAVAATSAVTTTAVTTTTTMATTIDENMAAHDAAIQDLTARVETLEAEVARLVEQLDALAGEGATSSSAEASPAAPLSQPASSGGRARLTATAEAATRPALRPSASQTPSSTPTATRPPRPRGTPRPTATLRITR